ncbi:uncharacterized protein LOC143020572 [Oratosquilla oratoria]|uniref:uncharacterized protein LOC143020572 n=1 Tax=Oratosquilla oratoria TaxID=337810 RepID=UPI003F769D2E
MKVLILLALAALAAAEAEPEADPQLLLNAGLPISPIVSVKTEEIKPITYTVPSTVPFAAWPYTQSAFNTWPLLVPEESKAAESARAKREADPQILMNVAIRSWATPYTTATIPTTIRAPITAGALPFAYNPVMPMITTPGAIRTISTSETEAEAEATEVAVRPKREAEADPQPFINPVISLDLHGTAILLDHSFPTARTITYSPGEWPAAWSHAGLPIAYTLAKKTE